MIEEFESGNKIIARNYVLNLDHKHVPEMQIHAGLAHPPVFVPTVASFYRGMIVDLALALWSLPSRPSLKDIHSVLVDSYRDRPLVDVASLEESKALRVLDPEMLRGSNRIKLFAFASEDGERVRLVSVLDNLGKGASGAAVQNLNIMFGFEETSGL